jgi:hypothetical protein
MVYLGYHCDVDVASRKQVAARMDSEPVQSGAVGDADDSRKALGSVASEHPTNDHIHKKLD